MRIIVPVVMLLIMQTAHAENTYPVEIVQPDDKALVIEKVDVDDSADNVMLRGILIDKKFRITPQGHIDAVIVDSRGAVILEKQADYFPKHRTGGTPHDREVMSVHKINIFRLSVPKDQLKHNGVRVFFHQTGKAETHTAS